MTSRTLAFAALALLLSAAACNPRYCADHPYKDCRIDSDAAPDGPKLCKANTDCTAPTAVCDLDVTKTCVQCTPAEHEACSGITPVCASNACTSCTAHSECTASNVCLPDGSCADALQVAYVASGGTGTECSQAAPCGSLANGVKTGRPYVKMATGTVADTQTTTIDSKAVTVFADPGAKLDRTGDGVILEVKGGGADVKIFDLEITGATGIGNPAISIPSGGAAKLSLTRVTVDANQGLGIQTTTGTLVMSRSIVKGNTAGGLSISGTEFDITNCLIVGNGGATSTIGGIDISMIATAGTHRLDFNTIASNQGPVAATINTGVNCNAIGTPLTFDSNIIYGNAVNGGGQQLGGSALCAAIYSDVGPDPTTGSTNINMSPMFVNAAQGDYHLLSTSPAKDAANPAATTNVDIDGDARPQGARRDIGADEVRL